MHTEPDTALCSHFLYVATVLLYILLGLMKLRALALNQYKFQFVSMRSHKGPVSL